MNSPPPPPPPLLLPSPLLPEQEQHSNWTTQLQLVSHRQHHSLDSFSTSNHHIHPNQQQQQPPPPTSTQSQPSPSSTITHTTKRSLSLSSQSTHPSLTTQRKKNPQPCQKPPPSKPKSKPPLISAIPASVLKKDKPGLLSQEQKRANHIASEQKRRAAIRQGYSRLCLIVPALKMPIGAGAGSMFIETGDSPHEQQSIISRDDSPGEEELAHDHSSAQNNPQDPSNSGAFKRKRNKPLEVNRSGARSEAVVLAKTVEYLRELEVERKLFIEKLKRLRSIARAKGIPIHNHHHHPHHNTQIIKNQTEINSEEDRYRRTEDKIHDHQEEVRPVWECKWTGNIDEIDRQLKASITDRNPLNLNLLIAPSHLQPTPFPFDLTSFHQDQLPLHPQLHHNNIHQHQHDYHHHPNHHQNLNPLIEP